MSEKEQSNDGYACSCGFRAKTITEYKQHQCWVSREVRKGNEKQTEHKSLGRFDLLTGEITMPPYPKRTKLEKEMSRYAKKNNKPVLSGPIEIPASQYSSSEELFPDEENGTSKNGNLASDNDKNKQPLSRNTSDPNVATVIKVIPRVLTMDYTPIMHMAQTAAIREFHWRSDMPLPNFIDTVMYLFFKEHGIILAGYIKEEDN